MPEPELLILVEGLFLVGVLAGWFGKARGRLPGDGSGLELRV